MNYLYKRKAQTIAIRNIFISMTLFSLMGLMLFLYITRDNFPLPMLLIGVFLGLLIGIYFLKQGLKLFKNKGVWEIAVNSSGVLWKSPDEKIDNSFKYNLNEIKSTETIVKKWKRSSKATFTYYLILKSGERHELPGHTGVNLKKIISTLEKLGIENNHKVIPEGVHATIKQTN